MATDVIPLKVADYTYVVLGKSSPLKSSAKTLMALRGGGTGTANDFLNFGLPKNYAARYCLAGVLEVTLDAAPSSAPIAQRVDQPTGKAFGGVTYANQPGAIAGSTAVNGTLKAGTTSTYQFDVTAEMNLVIAGAAFYGFRITTADTTARNLKGPQATSGYPTLTLTLTDDTPVPQALGPAGVTALAKPVVSWASPNNIDQIRLQVDVVGGAFTAPIADTGVLSAALGSIAQQINTATTSWTSAAWAGLTSGGAGVDVRVWQHGPKGGVWSAPITITRSSYGALTTSAPTSGGTTTDPTPPHAWTFANQRQWRLWVTDAAGKIWYDSLIRAGADQAWTPTLTSEQSRLLPDLATLTSHLQVWDTVTGRVASAGDTGYVETAWTWTVIAGATTAPASLTATQVGRTPAVKLQWPATGGVTDEYLFLRDGVIIGRVSGTSVVTAGVGTWTDWTANAFTPHVYGVAAISNNVASARTAAQSVTTTISGLWICHPSSGKYFSLAGEQVADSLDLASAEVLYHPVYSPTPVKRTTALRGYEGSTAGVVDVWDNRPIADQLADLHAIRTMASETMRVAFANRNIPAVVSGLTETPGSDWMKGYQVARASLRIDQNGEFPDTLVSAAA